MFESGMGGDFETYIGAASGTIYRLDLGKIHYQGKDRSVLLAQAINTEGHLICTSGEIRCKICGTKFTPTSIGVDGEEIVDAWEL